MIEKINDILIHITNELNNNKETYKNKIFKKNSIIMLEKRIQEYKDKIKNVKCHDPKDNHYQHLINELDLALDSTKKIFEECNISDKKSDIKTKLNFNNEYLCCDLFKNILNKKKLILNRFELFEKKITIKELDNPKNYQKRFCLGQHKNLSLEIAQEKKNDLKEKIKETSNKFNKCFNIFMNEQKKKEEENKKEIKEIENKIDNIYDQIIGLNNKTKENERYIKFKIAIIELQNILLDLIIDYEKSKLKSDWKYYLSWTLGGIACIAAITLLTPAAASIASMIGTTSKGIAITKGIIAGIGGFSAAGSFYYGYDYIQDKDNDEINNIICNIENNEKNLNNIQSNEIKYKFSSKIDEEFDSLIELIEKTINFIGQFKEKNINIENNDKIKNQIDKIDRIFESLKNL